MCIDDAKMATSPRHKKKWNGQVDVKGRRFPANRTEVRIVEKATKLPCAVGKHAPWKKIVYDLHAKQKQHKTGVVALAAEWRGQT